MIINSQQQDNSERVIPISEGGFGTSSEEEFYQLMLNIIRPIGSLYITSEAVHPSDLFGGEWEQITDAYLATAGDLYPVAQYSGTNEKTVPLIRHSHTVTPNITSTGSSHMHGFYEGPTSGGSSTIVRWLGTAVDSERRTVNLVNTGVSSHNHTASFNSTPSGSSDASIDISPLSYEVYIWRRIS